MLVKMDASPSAMIAASAPATESPLVTTTPVPSLAHSLFCEHASIDDDSNDPLSVNSEKSSLANVYLSLIVIGYLVLQTSSPFPILSFDLIQGWMTFLYLILMTSVPLLFLMIPQIPLLLQLNQLWQMSQKM